MTNLAQELASAESMLMRVDRKVERLLDSLYGNCQAFEYDATRVIEVFGVRRNPDAVDALLRAGFAAVVEHWHEQHQFTICNCRHKDDE